MNQLDVIIPVKNEAKNVPLLVERLGKTLTVSAIDYQLIFVDDHSTDKTVDLLKQLSRKYPIKIHLKVGKYGKAQSILEGAALAHSDYIAMIDADLQYPPEAIPKLFYLAKKQGVAIANRKVYKSTLIRRFSSRINAFVFGRLLLGLGYDIQSGLKVFPREIIQHLDLKKINPWSFDLPLLYTARELGLGIDTIDITFEVRKNGASKINFLETSYQIATSALKLKFSKSKIYQLKPREKKSMIGAGISFGRRRYITHTTLHPEHSALKTFKNWQKFVGMFLLGLFLGGLVLDSRLTLIVTIAILSTIYFADVCFNFFLLLKSLHFPPEIPVSDAEIAALNHRILPIYSILCPLYKEAHVLPQFIEAIEALDYPKHRLEVLFLLEEDDKETIRAAQKLNLPSYMKIVVVPDSQPKTKPKALNYGLSHVQGKYVVIYDAEDKPDPLQLKKAYVAFSKVSPKVYCLQAKLNYYNPHQNLLTRLFTAEYSLWFDLTLPGLQSINTTIPLGGTSNHFRTEDLKKLQGWDAFNVTEDCDLGVRLFKQGYKTAMFDSITLEEANSDILNWFRQRSRWIKGYVQTYLVHMRKPFQFAKEQRLHAFTFQLIIGGKVAFMLINPLLWLATLAYFILYAYVGPAIESVYPTPVFYMAATSLVVGNFMYLYNYMIGVAKKDHWSIIKYVFFIPVYWLMVSAAAVISLTQLIFKPHYWEKTHHGLHLKYSSAEHKTDRVLLKPTLNERLPGKLAWETLFSSTFTTGTILVGASMVANFFSYVFNAYLGRAISVEEFGLISLISSIISLSQIPLGSYARTVTHQEAYLYGKYSNPVKTFWTQLRKKAFKPTFISVGLWLISIPFLTQFFHLESFWPLLLLTPVWAIGILSAIDAGFLTGAHKFIAISVIIVAEMVTKVAATIILVQLGLHDWVYIAFPLSSLVSFVIAYYAAKSVPLEKLDLAPEKITKLSRRFFSSTVLIKLSGIAFLSIDVVLAKHFLSPVEAGLYSLLALVGKAVYALGSLFIQFVVPIVSREEGAGRNSKKIFKTLVRLTSLASISGFITIGLFGQYTVPLLFGSKINPILPLVPWYVLAMASFAITSCIVAYYQSKRKYFLSVINAVFVVALLAGIWLYHDSIATINAVVTLVSLLNLLTIVLLHQIYPLTEIILANVTDLSDLFKPKTTQSDVQSVRILVFNWRDTQHTWAGGAETYIHELAKRWVVSGHPVTLFCGNDGKSPRNQTIDGVHIVRRGGLYTVYLWAILYYVLRFRSNFDVVVDCENGIPFFTPLFVRIPKVLQIHHVHQEVFRKHLIFPLSLVGVFLETKVMPQVYRHTQIITISESSKKEIVKLGFTDDNQIHVVYPGVDLPTTSTAKTNYPSLLYLGRIRPYKQIDVAIKAFARIVADFPAAKMTIAGEGVSLPQLQKLVTLLKLEHSVSFTGKVSDAQKIKLLSSHWLTVQPSAFEGWGMTVIESNACGTPVIASDVNGLCDSVIHLKTGLLVTSNNIAELANNMKLLIRNDRLRNQLAHEARTWSTSFNWDESAKEFLRIIQPMRNKPEILHLKQLRFSKA